MKPTPGAISATMAVLLLSSLSCSVQPRESAAASAATPTGAPLPLVNDNFSDAGSGWATGADNSSSVEYETGGLHMRTFQPEYFAWSNPNAAAYENVHVEVTVKDMGSDPHAGFGIMCDEQPSAGSYYYFAITPGGEYVIGKSVMGQKNIVLTGEGEWTTAEVIPRNASNYRLGADCGPGTLTLYVDGKVVDSVRDAAYIRGEVGLFVLSRQAVRADVLYDNFVVTRLK